MEERDDEGRCPRCDQPVLKTELALHAGRCGDCAADIGPAALKVARIVAQREHKARLLRAMDAEIESLMAFAEDERVSSDFFAGMQHARKLVEAFYT